MPQQARARLPRSMILRGRDAVSRVFSQGDGFRIGEIVFKYLLTPAQSERVPSERSGQTLPTGTIRTAFMIRRTAGKAVRRNRIRRLLREAWRIQRAATPEDSLPVIPDGYELHLVLLWSGTPEQAMRPKYATFVSTIETGLQRLRKRLQQKHESTAK